MGQVFGWAMNVILLLCYKLRTWPLDDLQNLQL